MREAGAPFDVRRSGEASHCDSASWRARLFCWGQCAHSACALREVWTRSPPRPRVLGACRGRSCSRTALAPAPAGAWPHARRNHASRLTCPDGRGSSSGHGLHMLRAFVGPFRFRETCCRGASWIRGGRETTRRPQRAQGAAHGSAEHQTTAVLRLPHHRSFVPRLSVPSSGHRPPRCLGASCFIAGGA